MNEQNDAMQAEVSRLMAKLSAEIVPKDRKKALADLTRLASVEAYHSVFSHNFDKLLFSLKPCLGDRALRPSATTLLGQLGNSSIAIFDALVKWHFNLLAQSKQADKRAQRLSQLSDFVQAYIRARPSSPTSASPSKATDTDSASLALPTAAPCPLQDCAASILAYSWGLLEPKTLESLAAPLLALTAALTSYTPETLLSTSFFSPFIRAFVHWGSQEANDDLTLRFVSCASSLARLLRLAPSSFLETMTTMMQEFVSVPLGPVSATTGGSASGSTSVSTPKKEAAVKTPKTPNSTASSSKNVSSTAPTAEPSPDAQAVGENASAPSEALSPASSAPTGSSAASTSSPIDEVSVTPIRSTSPQEEPVITGTTLPTPNLPLAVSLLRALVDSLGSCVWSDPKLTFATIITLFATSREVHRTNHTFSYRYQWDVACTQLIASFSELNSTPRIAWEARTLSLYSFWFAEHVSTFSTMRLSKLVSLLQAHIRLLSNFSCSQAANPSNLTPFWAPELLSLRNTARNREVAALIHQIHLLIITQWSLDVDACEWIPSNIISHLKHEIQQAKHDSKSSALDQCLEALALQDIHLLTALYHRFSEQSPYTAFFSEEKSQRLSTERVKSVLNRVHQAFPLSVLMRAPRLQPFVIQLIKTLTSLSGITLIDTLAAKQGEGFSWETLFRTSYSSESKSGVLTLLQTINPGDVQSSESKIDPTCAQETVFALLQVLMDSDPQTRLEASQALLHLCNLHHTYQQAAITSNTSFIPLLEAETMKSIRDQLVVFCSLADSHHPVRLVLTQVLVVIGAGSAHELGQSRYAARFFPNWKSLLPLALDAVHPPSFAALSTSDDSSSNNLAYFGKSEFAATLSMMTAPTAEENLIDRSLSTLFDVTRTEAKLRTSWIDKLPELSNSVVFGEGKEMSSENSNAIVRTADLAAASNLENRIATFISQRLVRYSSAAKECWAMWETSIFAVLTKLKPCFPNPKELLAFLESNLIPKDGGGSHHGVHMMLAARRRLSLLEKFEKAVFAASPGSYAMSSICTHPSAQFFQNNSSVCADWFAGVRKQSMLFSKKFGTSSDVLRQAFVRLWNLISASQTTNPSVFIETAEYRTLIVSITEGLLEKKDTDSLRALHVFLSQNPVGSPQTEAFKHQTALLEMVRAALLQSDSNFESALSVYASLAPATAYLTDEFSQMRQENINQCILALGNWNTVQEESETKASGPEPKHARSLPSQYLVNILRNLTDDNEGKSQWSSQRIVQVHESLQTILKRFSDEPPRSTQSFGAFIDTALIEALFAIKANPNADVSELISALDEIETAAVPFFSSASAQSAINDLNILVEKLRVAKIASRIITGGGNTSHFVSSDLNGLSLPALTQLQTFDQLISGQTNDILGTKIMRKALKGGNLKLAELMCERLPETLDALLTRATLASMRGTLLDGFKMLWESGTTEMTKIAEFVFPDRPSGIAIKSARDRRLGLAICEILRDGRRDPSILSFVSGLITSSASRVDPTASNSSLSSSNTHSSSISTALSSTTFAVDALREKLLESLRTSSDFRSSDASNLDSHFSYADAVYSRGTILTKKAESDPLAAVSVELKDRLKQMCSDDAAISEAVIQAFVPQCLLMLMDEHKAHQSASVLKAEMEKKGIVATAGGLDFQLAQWVSDLIQHLLTPYNRAMQSYTRSLYLSASSGAQNDGFFDRALRAALRLLRLLTKYGDEILMASECLDAVPVGVWTHLIPQLISRLGHSHPFVRNQVLRLLIKIATSHPQLVIYQSLVRSNASSEREAESKPASTTATRQSISAQYRSKPLITTSKIGGNAKNAGSTSSSHSTAKLQSEQLQKLKYSLVQLHPGLVSDTQLLLNEFERMTILPDEKALVAVLDFLTKVKRHRSSIQSESAHLQTLYPSVETRINMLKEKHAATMRSTVAQMETLIRDISSFLVTSAPAPTSSSSTSPTPEGDHNTAPSKDRASEENEEDSAKRAPLPSSFNPIEPSRGATSKFERLFASNVLPILKKCVSDMRDEPQFAVEKQGRISVQVLSLTVNLLQDLHTNLSKSVRRKSFHLSSVAPRLASLQGSTIVVPGIVQSSSEANNPQVSTTNNITIQSVDDTVPVLATLTRPKKIRVLGSNGETFTFLLKGHEDLQLDERIMQILSTANHLLKRDKQTRSRGETARHYSVIPTSTRSGIIQWVRGTTPMYQLFMDHQKRVQKQLSQAPPSQIAPKPLNATTATAPNASSESSSSTADHINSTIDATPRFVYPTDAFVYKLALKLSKIGLAPVPNPSVRMTLSSLPPHREWPEKLVKQVFEELLQETPNDVFWKSMWAWSGDVESHSHLVQKYNKSMATMSIVGYVLGLGDRHLNNLLLDVSTGEVVHIDYNICFEAGLRLPVPEVVPFRLTPNLVTALGILGLQGAFQISAQHVLRVLSQSRETLLTMLEAFVYDPLVDWMGIKAPDGGEASKQVEKSDRFSRSNNPSSSALTSANAHPGSSATNVPHIPSSNAATVAQLRVVLSLFAQRLTQHASYLLSSTQVNALRTNITQMYSHAHLLLHSKTEHEKLIFAANERATQRKSLDDALSTAQKNVETAKKAFEKNKSKMKEKMEKEKESEVALRSALVAAQETYLQTTFNCINGLLGISASSTSYESGETANQVEENQYSLYAMITGPLPSFLHTSTLVRPLSAFSSTKDWPQLPLATLARAKETNAAFDAALKAFDASLSRANRLLSTYKAIASQLPRDYTSLAAVEEWLGALESLVTSPSHSSRESLRERLSQRYGGSFEAFTTLVTAASKSTSSLTSAKMTPNEKEEWDRACLVLASLQSDIDQHSAELAKEKEKGSATERELVSSRTTLAVAASKLVDKSTAPPGLSTINVPELALKYAAVQAVAELKVEFASLEEKETLDATEEDGFKKWNLGFQKWTPFSDPTLFTDPLAASLNSSLPQAPPSSAQDSHATSESLSASLRRAYTIIAKRLKTASIICPSIFSSANLDTQTNDPTSLAGAVPIADLAESLILILQSLTSSLTELCANLNSIVHMDANQAILEFVNSSEYALCSESHVQMLRNFLNSQLSPSHPMVILDRFLGLAYDRFAQLYYSITGSMQLPSVASNFFEAEHSKLFTRLAISPSPSTLLLQYFSDLLYKIVLDQTFAALNQRVSMESPETWLPEATLSSFNSLCGQMELELAEVMVLSDNCAIFAWQQALETMKIEKLQNSISDAQNECTRIEWCVDHLVDRSGVAKSSITKQQRSMRRQLLSDFESCLKDLTASIATLDHINPNYTHAEDVVTKLMSTRISQALEEEKSIGNAPPTSSVAQNASQQLESARNVFMTSCSMRRETITALQNIARESVACLSSVLRLEREVRSGRVEAIVCGQEATNYIGALESDPEIRERFDRSARQLKALEEEDIDLRDKLNVLNAQLEVDALITKNFAQEVGTAREQVLPATTATRKALVTHNEVAIERDLDLLFSSIAHRSNFTEEENAPEFAGNSSSNDDLLSPNDSSPPHLLVQEIHNVALQLEKATTYLRTEIRCLTAPLSNFLLNPSSATTQAAQSSVSSSTPAFNAMSADLPAGQKRLLDALKLRKRLLVELEKLAQRWLSLHPGVAVSHLSRKEEGESHFEEFDEAREREAIQQQISNASITANTTVAGLKALPIDATHPHLPNNNKAINILKRIQQKLDNTDPLLFPSSLSLLQQQQSSSNATNPPHHSTPTISRGDLVTAAATYSHLPPRHTVEEQVNALISEAMNRNNLQSMYLGWLPWV